MQSKIENELNADKSLSIIKDELAKILNVTKVKISEKARAIVTLLRQYVEGGTTFDRFLAILVYGYFAYSRLWNRSLEINIPLPSLAGNYNKYLTAMRFVMYVPGFYTSIFVHKNLAWIALWYMYIDHISVKILDFFLEEASAPVEIKQINQLEPTDVCYYGNKVRKYYKFERVGGQVCEWFVDEDVQPRDEQSLPTILPEMMSTQSVFKLNVKPKYLLDFYVQREDGIYVKTGHGFVADLFKEVQIITAYHVYQASTHFGVVRNGKTIVIKKFHNPEVWGDICFLPFEPSFGASLGVSSIPVSRLCLDYPVTVNYVDNSYNPVSSTSALLRRFDEYDYINVTTNNQKKSIVAYEASTISGASGAPVIQNNKVVGVHLGAITSKGVNYFSSLRIMFLSRKIVVASSGFDILERISNIQTESSFSTNYESDIDDEDWADYRTSKRQLDDDFDIYYDLMRKSRFNDINYKDAMRDFTPELKDYYDDVDAVIEKLEEQGYGRKSREAKDAIAAVNKKHNMKRTKAECAMVADPQCYVYPFIKSTCYDVPLLEASPLPFSNVARLTFHEKFRIEGELVFVGSGREGRMRTGKYLDVSEVVIPSDITDVEVKRLVNNYYHTSELGHEELEMFKYYVERAAKLTPIKYFDVTKTESLLELNDFVNKRYFIIPFAHKSFDITNQEYFMYHWDKVDKSKSPGAPLKFAYSTNKQLEEKVSEIYEVTKKRVAVLTQVGLKFLDQVMATGELPRSPELAVLLVKAGATDPVVTPIKGESRLSGKKPRLVSSVSVVDNLVMRLLIGDLLALEQQQDGLCIATALDITTQEITRAMHARVSSHFPIQSDDVQGYEYTMTTYDLLFQYLVRLISMKLAKIVRRGEKCVLEITRNVVTYAYLGLVICQANPVAMFEDGSLCYTKQCRQLSGKLSTFSDNSITRAFLAIKAAKLMKVKIPKFILTAGDDCLNSVFRENDGAIVDSKKVIETYAKLGRVITDVEISGENDPKGSFTFCSTKFMPGASYQENILKYAFGALLKKGDFTREEFVLFEQVYQFHPKYDAVRSLLEANLLRYHSAGEINSNKHARFEEEEEY